MNQLLSSVEVGLELSNLATRLAGNTKAVVDKVKPYEERYLNTDIPDERNTIMLELLNSDEEIYTLVNQDTTIIPYIIKKYGDLTLAEAAQILLCSLDPNPADVAAMVSHYIDDADLTTTDEANPSIYNIILHGRTVMNIKSQFDIRNFMSMPQELRKNCEKADWDLIEISLAYLSRFHMLSQVGVI